MPERIIIPTVNIKPLFPVVHIPSAYMLNRINMLQMVAESLHVAVALPEGYRYGDINDAANELSSMIDNK